MKAMDPAIIPLIRKITPFNPLPNEALGEVAHRITKKRVSKGEMLYSQNHIKLKFLDILVSGKLEKFFYDKLFTVFRLNSKQKTIDSKHETNNF